METGTPPLVAAKFVGLRPSLNLVAVFLDPFFSARSLEFLRGG
jgi:hypothetical protein